MDSPSVETAAVLTSVGGVFDHVAHAVPSIRAVLPLYRDLLGGQPKAGGINPWGGHLAVHFEFPHGSIIELLQPARQDSPSVGAFLQRSPRGGLHHLTFKVPSLEAALESIAAAGLHPFGTLLGDPGWQETYLHPRETGGVLIQLAQAAPGIPPPLDRPLDDLLNRADAFRASA
jgi:methylmalonyl-CoA/ethylmalonyl-CoA epimerase